MKSINSSYYNNRIDELRGIACLLVYIFHSRLFQNFADYKFIHNQGMLGVALFFVISGYIFMNISLHKESINYKDFILNRVKRIFPLYFFYLLLLIMMYGYYFNKEYLFVYFTLQQDLGNFYLLKGMPIIIGHLWTIAVEFKFYLLFPFLFLFYKKNSFKYILSLCLFFIAISYIVKNLHIGFRNSLYYNLGFFFIPGIILSIINNNLKLRLKFLNKLHPFLFFLTLLCMIFTPWLFGKYGDFITGIEFSILSLSLLYFYVDEKPVPIFSILLQKLGTISFSFYMFHLIIIRVITPLIISKEYFYTSILLSFCLTILVSILTYNLIEKPFMNLRKKY